jgi:hypothetical protein
MLPLILAAAAAVTPAAEKVVAPVHYRIELQVRSGDPLGNSAQPHDRVLAAPRMVVAAGRPATVAVGDQNADGEFSGLKAEFVATPRDDGRIAVAVDFQLRDGVADWKLGKAGVRTKLALTPGETRTVRLAAKSPDDQTWFELTVAPIPGR